MSRFLLFPQRWLWRAVYILAGGFVIVSALAAWVMRDQIFQTFLDPGIPFQTYQAPPAPDYALPSAWAAYPEAPPPSDAPAVFFVHPTTYEGGAHWNAPYNRPQETAQLNSLVLPNFAAPFLVQGARLYAPHYRQAALYAFMNNREDSAQARLLAYGDVRAAFEHFTGRLAENQPFILAGAGQGAHIAAGLLAEFVATDEALLKQMAAAYLLEAPVPTDLFAGPLAGVPACTSPESVRCVISYNPTRPEEESRIEALTERSLSWDQNLDLASVSERALLCVNPLLWSTSEDYAPSRLHRGGAAAENLDLGETPSAMPSQTSAQCQNGVLLVEQPRARPLRRPGRLGEDHRTPPYNLFYMDLRQDAERRLMLVQTLLENEALYAPPLDAPIEVEKAPVRPVDG